MKKKLLIALTILSFLIITIVYTGISMDMERESVFKEDVKNATKYYWQNKETINQMFEMIEIKGDNGEYYEFTNYPYYEYTEGIEMYVYGKKDFTEYVEQLKLDENVLLSIEDKELIEDFFETKSGYWYPMSILENEISLNSCDPDSKYYKNLYIFKTSNTDVFISDDEYITYPFYDEIDDGIYIVLVESEGMNCLF